MCPRAILSRNTCGAGSPLPVNFCVAAPEMVICGYRLLGACERGAYGEAAAERGEGYPVALLQQVAMTQQRDGNACAPCVAQCFHGAGDTVRGKMQSLRNLSQYPSIGLMRDQHANIFRRQSIAPEDVARGSFHRPACMVEDIFS